MALFQVTTPASIDALFTDLSSFATTNGWTQDSIDLGNNELELSRGNVFVQFQHDDDNISVHHSLGFSGGAGPGTQTDDSGNGKVSTPFTSERRVDNIGAGPFTNLFMHTDSTTGTYIHCILEYAPGLYRHFGFGTITKIGTWTGGEYAYGHHWLASGQASITDDRHTILFDSIHDDTNNESATLHVEGLNDQPGASKWGINWSGSTATTGTDTAGNARVAIVGTSRDGFLSNMAIWLRANVSNGFIPMIPVQLFYRHTTPSPEQWRLLGTMKDIRMMNIFNLEPQEEFTVGSDTWKVYPMTRKANAGGQEESKNMGIAYKKL